MSSGSYKNFFVRSNDQSETSSSPDANITIINRILERANLEKNKATADLFDILKEIPQASDLKTAQGYYEWAYKEYPKILKNLVRTYKNTDTEDLARIFHNLEKSKNDNGAMFAYILLDKTHREHEKTIDYNHLQEYFSTLLPEKTYKNINNWLHCVGKENIFLYNFALSNLNLVINISVYNDPDKQNQDYDLEEYDDRSACFNIDAPSSEKKAQFIRKIVGEKGDIQDYILYK